MPSSSPLAQLVSLACHDLRTPLATVSGFAHTLQRLEELGPPASRYVEMILAGSEQMADLLEELALVARIENGRYQPNLVEVDAAELAAAAAERAGEAVSSAGEGGSLRVDREPTERAIAALAVCAIRHGGVEKAELRAEEGMITVRPVAAEAGPVILGEDLKDLGAAVAGRLVEALGGSLELEGETLRVRLPT